MTRILVAALALLLSVSVAGAAGERCRVTDPTGTPLNVRAKPAGRVIGTLPNGTLVSIVAHGQDAKGKAWAKVRYYRGGRPIGWVFREFISCY